MKQIYIEAKDVRAFESYFFKLAGEIIDSREGVLLDSYQTYINDKTIAVLDTYETSRSSGLTVYISESEEDNKEVRKVWEDFTEKYDEVFGGVE